MCSTRTVSALAPLDVRESVFAGMSGATVDATVGVAVVGVAAGVVTSVAAAVVVVLVVDRVAGALTGVLGIARVSACGIDAASVRDAAAAADVRPPALVGGGVLIFIVRSNVVGARLRESVRTRSNTSQSLSHNAPLCTHNNTLTTHTHTPGADVDAADCGCSACHCLSCSTSAACACVTRA
jgi:hypothetical protein